MSNEWKFIFVEELKSYIKKMVADESEISTFLPVSVVVGVQEKLKYFYYITKNINGIFNISERNDGETYQEIKIRALRETIDISLNLEEIYKWIDLKYDNITAISVQEQKCRFFLLRQFKDIQKEYIYQYNYFIPKVIKS